MVLALSYIIAVVLTALIAVVLYPICALFWVFGLLGRASDVMFKFTSRVIKALWRDIRGEDSGSTPTISSADGWVCACGCHNTGKFCAECGAAKPIVIEQDAE